MKGRGALRRLDHPGRRHGANQRGASAVEFLFAGGIITILGTVVLQYVLLFNAKNMVGHASFMAARAGSLHHAQLPDIQDAYARALIPLYGGGRTSTELAHALQKARADIAGNTRIELLNPTRESFDDWADAALAIKYEGRRAIRNANQGLHSRQDIGATSGQNLQDANLIKVRITHGYELSVPFAGQLMQRLMRWGDDGQDAFKTQMYAQKRIPIITHATVQMQSDAVESDAMVAMPGMGNGGTPVDPDLPEVDTPPMPDCISWGCSVVADPRSPNDDSFDSGAGSDDSGAYKPSDRVDEGGSLCI